MRFNTHNRTPKNKTPSSAKLMLVVSWGLLLLLIVFIAIACSLDAKSVEPAVLVSTPFLILIAFLLIIVKDMEKAYVEIDDDTVCVVDYYFGIKKEKSFFIQDIAIAEITIGYSMRVHGYRYSQCGCRYIVFRDNNGKYLFKLICVPETKQFFEKYLDPH